MSSSVLSISVLMSIYINDSAPFLDEAFSSLLQQTNPVDEVVVVFDGPVNEDLLFVVSKYRRLFSLISIEFKIVELPNNLGLGLALLEGSKACRCKYIMRMDSDDISCVDRVEKTKQFIIDNPDFDVYGGCIAEFDSVVGDLNRKRIVPKSGISLDRFAKVKNPMNHVTVCIDRDSLISVGNYESMTYHEDYFLWVKFLQKGCRLINSSEVFVNVRVGSLSERRKGYKYFKYEVLFVKALHEIGYFSLFDCLRYLCFRLPVRFMPNWVVKSIYSRIRS